jgi:hypothetical protein
MLVALNAASQWACAAEVRPGSKAPIWCSAGDFRSTLISGHPQTGLAGPVRARSRLQRTYSITSPIFHSTT